MSSCLDWLSGSLSTHSHENGTEFASWTHAGGGAATGLLRLASQHRWGESVSVQSTLNTQNPSNEHTKAHRRPKRQPRTLSATIVHQHLSLTVALKRSHGLLRQGWSNPPPPSSSASPSSSLSLAWFTGRVNSEVPGTENLIVNGPPGTQGLTPLQFGGGARRSPGRILTVFQMG